jgi:hypothetical protein
MCKLVRNDLVHQDKELVEYSRTVRDQTAVHHIKFIEDYAYHQLIKETFSYSLYKEVVGYEAGLAYANLWMTFRPGDLIVTNKHNIPRVLVFESIERCFNRWLVKDTFTDSNDKNLGHRIHLISIRKHDNRRALVSNSLGACDDNDFN